MFLGNLLLAVLILTGIAVVAMLLNKRLLTLLLSSVFLLLVAMRLNISNMYLMGTVLLSLPLASYVVGWVGGRNLEVERASPASAVEGEAVSIQVDVVSPMALFSGFAQVNKHLPRHIRMVPDSECLTAIPNGVRHTYNVRATRRGVYRLAGCTVSLHDPLGIFLLNRRFPLSSSIVVYPTALPMDEARRLGEADAGWMLQTTSRRRGDEDDFYGTREYRVGDDMRRIHWRSSARQNQLVVVERERGTGGQIWLVLDTRAGSERGTDRDPTLERGVKLAVTLMEAALKRGDAVGFLAPGPSGALLPPRSGEGQRWDILDALARVKADGTETLQDALGRLEPAPGATVAVITGAPTRELFDAFSTLLDANVYVVAAPVGTAAPLKTTAYPAMTPGDFAGAAEAMGVPTLLWTPPVFAAPEGKA